MGVTIFFSFQAKTTSYRKARQIVERLRQRSLDLPFKEVSELVELSGESCEAKQYRQGTDLHHLTYGGGRIVLEGEEVRMVSPELLIAFSVWPGGGCGVANFGLAMYPATVLIGGKAIRTGSTGWNWTGCCDTDSAQEREFGGRANFVRCHLTIIKLLDFAAETGILTDVTDLGDYWRTRNVEHLIASADEWGRKMKEVSDEFGGFMEGSDS